ncbi:MAG TPA: SGNH/GDSL hydrolase family protein [Acidobacteriaceae bacterium]|nr:SGNH/GDSL hydrolase family protein [Acidobacteriaceae bacterium]
MRRTEQITRGFVRHAASRLSCCLALALLAWPLGAPAASHDQWLPTWSTAPISSEKSFDNQTIRMILRTTLGGKQVRIRISNVYGNAPLKIGAAHVALHQQGSAIVSGTDRALAFGGQPGIVIPPGASALSDPATLDVPKLGDLAVTLYIPGAPTGSTAHASGFRTTYISPAGDFTGSAELPAGTTTLSYYWLTDVYVEADHPAPVIVAFGDSITDGAHSTPDTNSTWPAVLGKLLLDKSSHARVAVLNEGIGGNRLLHDVAGTNALARFDRDVIDQPGASTVVLLEGINDIGSPASPNSRFSDQVVTSADLIQAMQQLIARCHLHNIKIVGATLTPYAGAHYYSPDGEKTREALNQWILTSGAFDAVVDLAKVTADPAQPDHFLAAYDSGDHLHPGDAGYQAMANAVAQVIEHMGK